MPEFGALGRLVMIGGIILIIVGAAMLLAGRIPWLGRLPGDIVVRREGFTLFAPITTMLLLSILLTVLFNLFRR